MTLPLVWRQRAPGTVVGVVVGVDDEPRLAEGGDRLIHPRRVDRLVPARRAEAARRRTAPGTG